jgi:hypothetical protein
MKEGLGGIFALLFVGSSVGSGFPPHGIIFYHFSMTNRPGLLTITLCSENANRAAMTGTG